MDGETETKRSACEADCTSPPGQWPSFERYLYFTERWGVTRAFKQSAFRGRPLAAVLTADCTRARMNQTGLEADAVINVAQNHSNLGQTSAVEGLRYVFLT